MIMRPLYAKTGTRTDYPKTTKAELIAYFDNLCRIAKDRYGVNITIIGHQGGRYKVFLQSWWSGEWSSENIYTNARSIRICILRRVADKLYDRGVGNPHKKLEREEKQRNELIQQFLGTLTPEQKELFDQIKFDRIIGPSA